MKRPVFTVQAAATVAVELLVAGAGFIILRLAAREFGPQGFGEFVAARRGLALIQLPLLMGIGIAMPRFMALYAGSTAEQSRSGRVLLAGLVLGLAPSFVVASLIALFPVLSARLLFDDPLLVTLAFPVAIGLLALTANTLSTAAWRGRFEIGRANLLQFAVMAVLPVAVFAFHPRDAASALLMQGALGAALAGLAWTYHLLTAARAHPLAAGWPRTEASELLHFGLPRIPGEFALVALFSLPPLILVRSEGAIAAGQLSFALSVVTLFATAFAPIGLVLLPTASRLAGQGDRAGLQALSRQLLLTGIPLALLGVLIAWPLVDWFTIWYLGPAFAPAIPLVRLGLLGVVPYAVYILFRNMLDAMDVRPVNSRNLLIALFVALAPALVWRSASALTRSTVLGLVLLGGLTIISVWTRLKPDLTLRRPVS